MSLFAYEIGMRVRYRKDPNAKGTIEEFYDNDQVSNEFRVNWDDIGSRWVEARDVMPDGPEAIQKLAELNKKIQANIDEAASLLEQAFKKWRLAEAMEWYGDDSLEEDRDDYFEGAYALRSNPDLDLSKFEEVVERNGWSTSSLYC